MQITLQELREDKDRIERGTLVTALTLACMSGATLSQDDVNTITQAREQSYRQSPAIDMVTGTSYDATKMVFAICANQNRTNGANDTQNGNGMVVTHIGLRCKSDLQLATFRELLALGRYSIDGPKGQQFERIDNRPLGEILVADGKQTGVPAVSTTVAATTASAGEAAFGEPELFKLQTPILVRSGNAAKLTIDGLSGTVAGTTPTWDVALELVGYELVGLTR